MHAELERQHPVAVAARGRRHPRPQHRLARALALAACAGAAAAPAHGAAAVSQARFLVKGDWGFGGGDQAAVTRRMCAEQARRQFDAVLTVGDNFYPSGVATRDNWDRPEACLIRSGIPWHVTWGNHDLGGSSTATVLGARRRWYTFARGPVRVLMLDANEPGDPAQLAFLRDTLARSRAPVLVAAFHQPAYTSGIHAPDAEVQRLWVPLFRRAGVTLVLQGHNHDYERLRVGGITYVTTGGGGAPVYPCLRAAPGAVRCVPAHHFLEVTATRRTVRVRAVEPSGRTLDAVTIRVRPRPRAGAEARRPPASSLRTPTPRG
jgi:tartrate-resistant acid phosphatase type 5